MSTIAPPSNFNDSTYEILTATQLHAHTQTKVKLGTAKEARTSTMVPKTVHIQVLFLQYRKQYTEAGMSGVTGYFASQEIWHLHSRKMGTPSGNLAPHPPNVAIFYASLHAYYPRVLCTPCPLS